LNTLAVWSSDSISIRAPIENKEASTIKSFSGLDPIQTTINFFNNISDSYLTNSNNGLVGGNFQEWGQKFVNIGQNIEHRPLTIGNMMEEIRNRLEKIKRTDIPLFLDPKTATFIDVAIHAKVHQYLSDSTIEKHLRYARFMELHPQPIDFRNLTPESFINM
jgi:hypothetical protein